MNDYFELSNIDEQFRKQKAILLLKITGDFYKIINGHFKNFEGENENGNLWLWRCAINSK